MTEHDATEHAYKNGYAAGLRDAVKHAHWVIVPSTLYKDVYVYVCSQCKAIFFRGSSAGLLDAIEWDCGSSLYCPHCGAKMDEIENINNINRKEKGE